MEHSSGKAAFLGKVTASVTHELQNVLAIVKETSGLIEDFLLIGGLEESAGMQERLAKCLQTIKEQTYRGALLTSELNGFAHTADHVQASVNIVELAKRLLSVAGRLFRQRGTDISMVVPDQPYSVITDPVLLQMVMVSSIECLIENHDGNPSLSLEIGARQDLKFMAFSYNDSTLDYDVFKQKIPLDPQWVTIADLCSRINLKAELTPHTPGILITFQ